jgi:hypothetical protein
MSTLVLSGISIPVTFAHSIGTTGSVFPSASPTFTGTASNFLIGPNLVKNPFAGSYTPGSKVGSSASSLNPKQLGSDPLSTTVPPTVSCPGSGCYAITTSSDAKTNPLALNAYDNANVNPFTVEPPDQGLCAGNGYVMESLNQGEVQLYSSYSLKPVSGITSLDTLMGLTSLNWSSGGDIMCQYDYSNGGHWFITEIVSATSESSGGPFAGCFAAVPGTCYEGIAASVTSNPMGAYNVYFLAADKVNSDPGSIANPSPTSSDAGVLLNDYAKTATTKDAFLVFYDEFNLVTGSLNGAQEFAFSKTALEHGSSTVNVAYENMGYAPNLYPIPANGAYQPSPITGQAWYQVIPAQTTDPSQYDNSNGGTGYMMASLDFFGAGDNRIAVFDWTGLSGLNSHNCNGCSHIAFGGELLTGAVTYQDEGAACPVSDYLTISNYCGLGVQKAGPIPLGDNCALVGTGVASPCPEDGIASNGDGATDVFYSGGQLWTAVSTVVLQTFKSGPSEYHLGATYWAVSPEDPHGGVTFNIANQGYVTAAHEDMEFPAVAATWGSVLMSFTLNGVDYYPSSAYLMLSGGDRFIHISALGQSPQDGFTEYQYYGTSHSFLLRPRWGDYGQAVFDSSTGKFYFGSEYIQSPNCGSSAWLADPTCGGTRAAFANWGSSINSINPLISFQN